MLNIVMMLLDADLEVRDTALDVILTLLEDELRGYTTADTATHLANPTHDRTSDTLDEMSQKSTPFCLFSRKATRLSAKATRLVWEWWNPVSRGDTSSSALPLSHHHPRHTGAQPKLKELEAMLYSFGVWSAQVVVLAMFHSSRRRLWLCGEHPRRRQPIQTEKFNGHRRQKQMHVLSVATGSRGLEVPTTLFRALAYCTISFNSYGGVTCDRSIRT
ncbi:hypothetical protein C8R45DRAFT_923613 [Mycena sanguinolenta]|nr:hypothetical protein C8R45DRAFT_923613 [Mycena sanguinolenta]